MVLAGTESCPVQGLPRPGGDLGHRRRDGVARLLQLQEAVVADGLEVPHGAVPPVAQGQQRAGPDLDVTLLDGAPGPVQGLFGRLDDDAVVGAGIVGALDDQLLYAGDDLGRGEPLAEGCRSL